MTAEEHRAEAFRLYGENKSCCAQIHERMWREMSSIHHPSRHTPVRPVRSVLGSVRTRIRAGKLASAIHLISRLGTP